MGSSWCVACGFGDGGQAEICELRLFGEVDASRYDMVWYGMFLRDLVGNLLRSGTDTFKAVSVSWSH